LGVFGDPHILSYSSQETVETCENLGWHKYIENEYFKLQAYGEYASEDRDSRATYITAVNKY